VQADFADLPDVAAVTQLVLRLLLTALLGGLLGYQREHQGKEAGSVPTWGMSTIHAKFQVER
jgi:putative Mg2+ transporter-C (MgtC) family protein